ncbi:MAG: gluconate 2-dehydrogenase subunit 3 family protein [Bacteroidota bacterium]
MNRREAIRKASVAAGTTILTPALLSLLQSCQSEPRIDWVPRFLSHEEAAFLGAFIDTILPRTATPGGLDVKVDVFLDRIIAETYDEAGQEYFRTELNELADRAKEQYGATLSVLNDSDRTAFLMSEEKEGGKFRQGVWGTPVGEGEPVSFYRNLKSMVIWGYLTSEKIGTDVLRYDPIPGNYLGCIPLAEGERSWSL